MSDKQQWEAATKFMENALEQELVHEELELNPIDPNASRWKRLIGWQSRTVEEHHRRQCRKELQRVLFGRQQLDRSTMNTNYSVSQSIDETR